MESLLVIGRVQRRQGSGGIIRLMNAMPARPSHLVNRNVLTVGVGLVLGMSFAHLNLSARDVSFATGVRAAASLSTQGSPDAAAFQQILHNYRIGPAQEAISELAGWRVNRLAAAAKASTPNLSSSDRMAAAILQAEVARALLVIIRSKSRLS